MTSQVFAGTTPLFTVQVLSAVPEASTWMLLLGGLAAMAIAVRRRYF
jgi:hypothetical protein